MKAISALSFSVLLLSATQSLAQVAAATATMGPLAASFVDGGVEQAQQPPITVTPPILTTPSVVSAHAERLKVLAASCTSKGSLARGVCLTSLNPKIATAASAITALLAGMDMAKGQKEACEKFGGAMDIAKAAVTAYTGACGAARLYCTTTCGELTKYITSVVQPALAKAAADQYEAAAAAKDQATLSTYLALPSQLPAQLEQCDKYKLKIASATVGIINIVQSAKGGKQCSDQLAGNDGATDLDCSKPENAKVVECMCRLNPTLAGCVGGGTGANNNPYQSLTGDGYQNADGETSSGNIDLSAAPTDSASGFASSGSDSAGGGFGGPAGGGAGGLGANGTGKAADGGGHGGKPLNKNILSGYEGGSGGGGGGGGYADNAYADQFKQFMPGGDKDPSRNPANALFAGGQVTGNGGKSNWEKVRERYQANRPSLIVGGP